MAYGLFCHAVFFLSVKGYFSKTALAGGIPMQGFAELGLVKLRPQGVSKVQLGIRSLPQQKVADALLAARADEQVNVRHACGAEVLRQLVLREVTCIKCGVGSLPVFNSLHHIPLAAIVGSHAQGNGLVMLGGSLGCAYAGLQLGCKAFNMANNL